MHLFHQTVKWNIKYAVSKSTKWLVNTFKPKTVLFNFKKRDTTKENLYHNTTY